MCIQILVTTFPEWLSGTEQLPHIRRRASVCVVFVVFCVHMHSFPGLIRRTPVTLQSPTATLIPYFPAQSSLVCWIGKIVWTCAPGGSRTLDFLCARPAPYPLGQALRSTWMTHCLQAFIDNRAQLLYMDQSENRL